MPDILSIIAGGAKESRPLDLGDYAEDYRGAVFDVWVTPSQAQLDVWSEIVRFIADAKEKTKDLDLDVFSAELEDRKTYFYSGMWLNIDHEEAVKIRNRLLEVDPNAWEWLCTRTHEMVRDFREGKLKN